MTDEQKATAPTSAGTTEKGQSMDIQDDWNAEDFMFPEWVERRSDGNYMEPGAQLATRDGRMCGNAYVDGIEPHDSFGQVAVVVTDMGNSSRMTIQELEEAFYPPAYVMRLDEARARRGVTSNAADCTRLY